MLTAHMPANWDRVEKPAAEGTLIPWATISGSAVTVGGAGAALAAGGMPDWTPEQWHVFMGFLGLFLAGLLTTFGTVAVKIIRAIRDNGKKTDSVANRTASAATVAVTRAVDESALPTTNEQKAKFAEEMAGLMAEAMLKKIDARQSAGVQPTNGVVHVERGQEEIGLPSGS